MVDETELARGNAGFALSDLDYVLPPDLIAQHPLPGRDDSRLLVVDRTSGAIRDGRIGDLRDLLRPGDLLVLNDTKVVPAKFSARRMTGGRVDGLFVEEECAGCWRVLLEGTRRLRIRQSLRATVGGVEAGVTFRLLESCGHGSWRVAVEPSDPAEAILDRIGMTPLPPYIHRDDADPSADLDDRRRYQTVYARRPGAIAAPTAGLHLTEALLDAIRARGIETAFVTLHVGLGTFKPINSDDLSKHVMHTERYELPMETAQAVERSRRRNGRVVAVGTTSVRVLESAGAEPANARLVRASSGLTGIFIYPPYRFRVVDALLTNFHLPKSTLLALVMAMAGVELIRSAYRHAIARRYRFYSFGDAMLIL